MVNLNRLKQACQMGTQHHNIHIGEAIKVILSPSSDTVFSSVHRRTNGGMELFKAKYLLLDELNKLSCTWESGEKHTITWIIQDLGDGKVNLHLEQAGISNEHASQVLSLAGVNGAASLRRCWLNEVKRSSDFL